MVRKWLIWIFVDSSFAVEGRVESVFGSFILRRSPNLRTLWLHRHLDRICTPIRGRLALTIVVGALLPSLELYISGQR